MNPKKRIRCWQVDAFTDRPFAGNPAAICYLDSPADPQWMQAVAVEMNLSETAFVRPLRGANDGHSGGYELRWFTPAAEVDLCGHATLAAAHALWHAGLAPPPQPTEKGAWNFPDAESRPGSSSPESSRHLFQPIHFHTRSGLLTCSRDGPLIELDFPALPPRPAAPPAGLIEALGLVDPGSQPSYIGQTKYDYLLVLPSPQAVRSCRPDFRQLIQVPTRGIIITSRSDDERYDFLSRTFFPSIGVDEDPVCGSAHCSTSVYWGEQLGKSQLLAWQASPRGGAVHMRIAGDRIILGGQAVTVWEGELLA